MGISIGVVATPHFGTSLVAIVCLLIAARLIAMADRAAKDALYEGFAQVARALKAGGGLRSWPCWRRASGR